MKMSMSFQVTAQAMFEMSSLSYKYYYYRVRLTFIAGCHKFFQNSAINQVDIVQVIGLTRGCRCLIRHLQAKVYKKSQTFNFQNTVNIFIKNNIWFHKIKHVVEIFAKQLKKQYVKPLYSLNNNGSIY